MKERVQRRQEAPGKSHQGRAAAGGPPAFASNVSRMQSTIGNRAVMQLMRSEAPLIQRLPTRQQAEDEAGKAKEHVKNPLANTWLGKKLKVKENLKENSTRYRKVLDKLDVFDNYVSSTEVASDSNAIQAQLDQIVQYYADVEKEISQYGADKEDGKPDEKIEYFQKVAASIPAERAQVVVKGHELMNNPPAKGMKWKTATSITHGTMVLNDKMSTNQTEKGGINSVSFFKQGRSEGAFKQDKTRILTPDELGKDASEDEKEAAVKESGIAEDFGIDMQDARLAKRNVAMSRLDQMLGAGVIAKAELAVYQSPDGQSVQGSFMEKAKGGEAGKMGKSGKIAKGGQGGGGKVDVDDANLQRCLSRLQLIDTLAMQADRHQGNYFINYDQSGNVLGVTGIDNDMSFGTRTAVDKMRQEYPGLSKFVDQELAERILALKPEDLELAMLDLLSPGEIKALLTRLEKLQAHLMKLKSDNKLLTPAQWDQATAKGMLKEYQPEEEGGSYYGKLKNDVG
ncbi:hypothetical protein [Paenibacillus piri]|uniref:PI3K/PI4K catalytic domain-containing protein n=1 Tax=Paenibacillus piri TaxID=2547395 RepID=A0A4R5KCZ3_9BACL|nr:hypothetical protein [Paenibacillus piri]TDF92368.1 hypothetical protein E1757_30350 [Paenibacillus piri]